MQFGFMPRRDTTGVILFVCQLQEKFYAVNKTQCMDFFDPEKAINYVARCAIWCDLRKLGVKEWLVRMRNMYENVAWGIAGVTDPLHGRKSVRVNMGKT